ncbi:SKP1/BTB/POZ domain,SKP1 component, POZ domain,S-phase kinase-associated protein 1-like [Cinara cedri]|uniref:Elongin-C n=1 Tax=Cinara cedri TaxID=506608 RepID=A0A5E4MS20_9HEMI|nr:SKP1/BTB/POZ domain,SKP1 component, POZ domain,S-phase kinase-associated protein 1-like [Cinara cedri]
MDYSEYGNCEGPDAMYVKLISKDGHEFVVKRNQALMSGTIEAMLSGPGQFAENQTNEISFKEIPSLIMKKVCMYLIYKARYNGTITNSDPQLNGEFAGFCIEPQLALELFLVAKFLDC